MEDLIHIKVKENDQGQEKWFEYGLSYEEFAMIQPVLEHCKDKHECPMFDPENPEATAGIFTHLLFPFQNQTQQRRAIIYNDKDRPKDMTREQVMETYERRGFLFLSDNTTETREIR